MKKLITLSLLFLSNTITPSNISHSSQAVKRVDWTSPNFESHINWYDLNADMDGEGNTAIHLAVEYERVDIFKQLVDRGVDLEFRSTHGRTPLIHAAFKNNVEMVRYLLDHGANPHALRIMKDNFERKETAVHNAACDERKSDECKKVIAMLVEAGVDPKARDFRGNTALNYAMGDAVDALIEAGADVNAKNDRQETPLHFTARYGNARGIQSLALAGACLQAQNVKGKTALEIAIKREKDAQDSNKYAQIASHVTVEGKEYFAKKASEAEEVARSLVSAAINSDTVS